MCRKGCTVKAKPHVGRALLLLSKTYRSVSPRTVKVQKLGESPVNRAMTSEWLSSWKKVSEAFSESRQQRRSKRTRRPSAPLTVIWSKNRVLEKDGWNEDTTQQLPSPCFSWMEAMLVEWRYDRRGFSSACP